MAGKRGADEIININVGGKRFTVRRSDLCADTHSRLYDWFKPGTTKSVAQDKAGNFFLDRDGKAFRHVVAFLRLKREGIAPGLALPSKPDDLARLVGEAEALQLNDLRDRCVEMLQRYQREESSYINAYVQVALRTFDAWHHDKSEGRANNANKKAAVDNYDDWDN